MQGNWAWGLSLTAFTIVVHAVGITALAFVLRWLIRDHVEQQAHFGSGHLFTIFIGLMGAVGLLLAVLHGLEAALWAVAYLWLGAHTSRLEAILYSIDSIATRGSSGVTVDQGWRVMGALEAVDGMLLFGMSTAFIFAVMQTYWPILVQPNRSE
jgi:hypothetical protein